MADVWSCGVTLYVMLVAAYPFEDQNDNKNFQKTIKVHYFPCCRLISVKCASYFSLLCFVLLQRKMSGRYKIPDHIRISRDCQHLLSCIFVRNPSKVIFFFLCKLANLFLSFHIQFFSSTCLIYSKLKLQKW